MEDLDLADPELAIIINIEENKICNDCQKKNPRWCSINNAIFLCPSCTRKHRKFNKNISTIKSIEGDLWTKEEIKKLYIGGNDRFNKLMASYNIPLTLENAKYKYHTKIAEYYRNLLNEEIKDKKIIDLVKPSLKEGIEIINKDEYDKLNQYAPSQNNSALNNNNNNNNEVNYNNDFSNILNIPQKENNFVNPFASDNPNSNSNSNNNNFNNNFNNNQGNNNRKGEDFNFEKHLNNFADSIGTVFSNISQTAQSIDYNEKLRNAGEFLKDKKEKIENSQTFKGFMDALSKGFDSFVGAAENYLNNNIDNSNQQRRNGNNFDNRNQNQVQFQGQRINNANNNGFMTSSMNFSGNNHESNNKNINENNNNSNNEMNKDINNNNENLKFFDNTPLSKNNLQNQGQNMENINSIGENDKNDNVENLDDDGENNK